MSQPIRQILDAHRRPGGTRALTLPLRVVHSLSDGRTGTLVGRWLRSEHELVAQVMGWADEVRGSTVATVGVDPRGSAARLHPGPPLRAALPDGNALEVIVVDTQDYHARVRGLDLHPSSGPSAGLAERTALVVGLGSVGSLLGAQLARLGVRVVGCDPDVLTVPNLIRWGLDASLDDIGRAKARLFEQRLTATVPGARVLGLPMDVVRSAHHFDQLVQQHHPDLIITTTDTRDSRRVVNVTAARHGVAALYVALSDGAASVRVQLVRDASAGPCYLCAERAESGSESGSEHTTSPPGATRRSRSRYAAETAEPVAVPALPTNITMGTSIATRVALDVLRGASTRAHFTQGAQAGDVLFVALDSDWWVFQHPLERLVYQPTRQPDCPVCTGPAAQEGSHAA